MTLLVINCGSSSIKFTLFDTADFSVVADGMVDRIGQPGATLHFHYAKGESVHRQIRVDHIREAIAQIEGLLREQRPGEGTIRRIRAIGHRVVHGGEAIHQPTLIDDRVKAVIHSCFELAPLHNPPNLEGIMACEQLFPGVPQVAVFDTAFHATLPPNAFLYALPYDLYRERKIRRYGFHGTSHRYVSRVAARKLGQPVTALRLITCHLGNGCSITAVCEGRSVDTSMGFTPLEGVPMGTRCGDIDPAIVFHLMRRESMTAAQIETLLIRDSGLKGLGGIGSSDMRDLEAAAQAGNRQAESAIRVFAYRVKKYIGAYAFAMGGLDAVVFTGGIGEKSHRVRQLICEGLERLGLRIDPQRNASLPNGESGIHHPTSLVQLWVIPTNEALEIARQTARVVDRNDSRQSQPR